MAKPNKSKIIIVIGIIAIIGVIAGKEICSKMQNSKESESELQGSITFVSNRTDKKDELEELINEFENIYPKAKVELELIGDAESILYRRAIVDELPDVTLIPGAIKVSDYSKYFLELDDLGFDNNDIYNYYTGVGADNKLYNLTTSITWNGIIYNKKVFKEAGIEKIPKTKEEFLEVCEKIKDFGKIPIALNYKQSWAINEWIDVIPNILNTDLESDVIKNNKDILGNESTLFKSLDFLREIVQNGYCEEDLINYEWETCKNDIKHGEVAMFLGSSGLLNQLEDMGMNSDDIGMFPFVGSEAIYVFGEYKLGIANNTKYPEIAKEFLKFIFQEDRYAKAVNILSPLKDSEEVKSFFEGLKSFNIPVEIYGETVMEYNEEYNSLHERYEELKKAVGIDYSFAQLYSTCDDPNRIIGEINEKWKQEKEKLNIN